MPHIERKPGDTVYSRGWWYRDEDDLDDTRAEYARAEYRDDAEPEDDE